MEGTTTAGELNNSSNSTTTINSNTILNGGAAETPPPRFRSLFKAGVRYDNYDNHGNDVAYNNGSGSGGGEETQASEAQLMEQLRVENAQLKRQILLQSKRIDWIEERFDLINWRVCSYDTWQLKGHHQLGVLCCRLNPTEGIVASGSNDKCILMWDLKNGLCTKRLRGHTGAVNSLYSEDNLLVSASSDKTICIWNFATGEFVDKITGHAGAIYKALIRGNRVYSASADRSIRIWDYSPSRNDTQNDQPATEEEVAKQIGLLEGHCGSVSSIHLHPVNQNFLISGSYDASVAVWDLERETMIKQYKGHESFVNSVTCSETLIASASNDCTVRIWDLRSNGMVASLTKHTDFVKDVKVHGSLLVSAAKDGTVILWDYHYHDPIRGFKAHQAEINQFELLDNLLVTCSEDRTLRVHNFKKCVL